MSKALDKMGDTAMQREEEEDDIGLAFQKFAVVTKELGALMKNMVRFTYWNHYPPPWWKIITNGPNRKIFGYNNPAPQRDWSALFGKW